MLRWTEFSKQRGEYDKLLAQCQDYFCKGHLAHYWLERAEVKKVGSKRIHENSQTQDGEQAEANKRSRYK